MPNFEAACGVTVNYDIYESNEAMLARIRQGNPGYDIIVPSGGTVQRMAEEMLLIPLDLEMIPNVANVIPDLLGAAYDPENMYSLPYQWARSASATAPKSSRTALAPGTRYGITMVRSLGSMTGRPCWASPTLFLGNDPNTTDADEISAARDYLIDKGGNVVTVAADDGQVLLERGDVDIAIEYNGDIFADLLGLRMR